MFPCVSVGTQDVQQQCKSASDRLMKFTALAFFSSSLLSAPSLIAVVAFGGRGNVVAAAAVVSHLLFSEMFAAVKRLPRSASDRLSAQSQRRAPIPDL